jgi:Ca2+-transporting ATPase
VTGDYRDTAMAIASEIGILSTGGKVLTGADLDQMSDDDLIAQVDQVDAFARVSPQHKTRIVNGFKARDHVVAMTGDGVNDAPALKRANIGIAMGITGTDVAKETADMVLTDDNYASIVSAIEEGRIIYSNIRKFVFYLIACNIPEILVIFLPMLAGLPLPLRPIQILWVNLVTDGLPAIALGLEKGEAGIMQQPPRPPKEPLLNRPIQLGILVQAVFKTAAVLGVFLWGLNQFPDNLAVAQTMTFVVLSASQVFLAYSVRSEFGSLFSVGLFANKAMLIATALAFGLLLPLMYVPFLRPIFDTVPLGLTEWLVIIPMMFVSTIAAEIAKPFLRRKHAAH